MSDFDREEQAELRQDARHARRRRHRDAIGDLQELGVPDGWELRRLNDDKHWQLRREGLVVNWYPTTGGIHAVGCLAPQWTALEVDPACQGLTGYAYIERIARRLSASESDTKPS